MNNYTYELVDDGYYIIENIYKKDENGNFVLDDNDEPIFICSKRIIEQRGVFADIILPNQTYEENAIEHIRQLVEAENNSNAQAEKSRLLKQTVEEIKEENTISLLAITELYEAIML